MVDQFSVITSWCKSRIWIRLENIQCQGFFISVQQRGSRCSCSILLSVLHAVSLDKHISNSAVVKLYCAPVISLISEKKKRIPSLGKTNRFVMLLLRGLLFSSFNIRVISVHLENIVTFHISWTGLFLQCVLKSAVKPAATFYFPQTCVVSDWKLNPTEKVKIKNLDQLQSCWKSLK